MAYATNSSGNYSGTIIVSPIRPANPIFANTWDPGSLLN
jgi:hypothetical protein